jgi:predicted DNA-binding transcriptional regulator AlpA
MKANAPTFIRSHELDERVLYQRERRRLLEVAGLYPPRIKLNCRTNVWIRGEVEAWESATAAGATDSQVRELIRRLIARRADGMPQQVAA